jgi:hypothetical protein
MSALATHRKKRLRRPLPGMLLFQDGSTHRWIAALGHDLDLIITLDDATGAIYSPQAQGQRRNPVRLYAFDLTPMLRCTVDDVVGSKRAVKTCQRRRQLSPKAAMFSRSRWGPGIPVKRGTPHAHLWKNLYVSGARSQIRVVRGAGRPPCLVIQAFTSDG